MNINCKSQYLGINVLNWWNTQYLGIRCIELMHWVLFGWSITLLYGLVVIRKSLRNPNKACTGLVAWQIADQSNVWNLLFTFLFDPLTSDRPSTTTCVLSPILAHMWSVASTLNCFCSPCRYTKLSPVEVLFTNSVS